jgi:penicillin-binding protein 2
MTDGRMGMRIKILAGLVLVMFAALTVRLWFLQVLATETFRAKAANNYVRLVKVPAPRGEILDDQGNVLVDNQPSIDVTINRQVVGDHLNEVLAKLSPLVHVPAAELATRVNDPAYYPYTPVPVVFGVPDDVAFAIGEHPRTFKGVATEQVATLGFPYKGLAPHLLGYTGPIRDTQVNLPQFKNYDRNDIVGQAGLEQQYESDLQGTKGISKFRIDAQGKNLGEIGEEQAPVPGKNVVLTLDAEAQTIAQDSLSTGIAKAQSAGFPATAGTVVVMDPKTGGIVALANQPTFDPRVFLGGISSTEAKQLGLPSCSTTNPNTGQLVQKCKPPKLKASPLLNLAMDGQYPPGSTIKPFIALAALKTGFATFNSQLPCSPVFKVGGTQFHNWTNQDLGFMNITQALIQSCDTVFYQYGYDFWGKYYRGVNSRGPELLQNDLKGFGFGVDPNVDFPSASSGLVPTDSWKYNTFKSTVKDTSQNLCDLHICPGDLIQMAIGQGDLRVTPLQMASAYSAIDNGGSLCQPRLAMQIQSPDGKVVRQIPPDCSQKIPYTASQLNYVKQALAGVPTQGTAAPAFVGFPFSQVAVAGKTGTAEVAAQGNQTDSWFACMTKGTVKGQSKDYVVVVMIERGGHGAETAAPVARQVIEGLYGLHSSGFHQPASVLDG